MHTHTLEDILTQIKEKYIVEFEKLYDEEQNRLELLTATNMQQHINALVARKSMQNPLKELPLWAKVWPASFVLGSYLRKTCKPHGKTLLELGAGSAVLSCFVARYGFKSIFASDIVTDALLFAKANVLHNNLQDIVTVRTIDIKNSREALKDDTFDIIAASEILYLEELHRPLLKCIDRHLAPGGMAVLCTDITRANPKFFKKAAKMFTVTGHKVAMRTTENEQEEKRHYILCILERP